MKNIFLMSADKIKVEPFTDPFQTLDEKVLSDPQNEVKIDNSQKEKRRYVRKKKPGKKLPPKKQFQCDICDRVIKRKQGLLNHMRAHTNGKIHTQGCYVRPPSYCYFLLNTTLVCLNIF